MSRSELQNGQPFPSVSSYTKPIVNPDGMVREAKNTKPKS
jgi:hypothetical protein